MNDTKLPYRKVREGKLISTYRRSTQFGLILGAGITVDSKVPGYNSLAIRLLEASIEQPQFNGSKEWVLNLVQQQKDQMDNKRVTIPPDELILCVRELLGNDKECLRNLVKQELYKEVLVATTAGRGVFEDNCTLDAVLTFCAACPGTILSPGKSNYEVEVNHKIGGILTTNYDNLVESAFHTKYRRNLLQPIGRASTNEFEKKERQTIPVYHIHGYVGFRSDKKKEGQGKYPDIIIAEDDYFGTFYDPLGFNNYIAMSFLRRSPSLFIGASMTDKNILRFLFHLSNAAGGRLPEHQKKFAILQRTGSPGDSLKDRVLSAYGVEIIWIKDFAREIPMILQKMYVASGTKDMEKLLFNNWNYLRSYRWPKKQQPKRA